MMNTTDDGNRPRRKLVTITTDFGADSHYVAQMKASLLSACDEISIVDITHSVPPQDILAGARTLDGCCFQFPTGTIHLAVIDPGVGSERNLLACEVAGHWFVGPDNGLFTLVAEQGIAQVRRIDTSHFNDVSKTFHGRDNMAPVAARLCIGEPLDAIGEEISDKVRLPIPKPTRSERLIEGVIERVDSFGNLLTNIRAEWLPASLERAEISVADRSRIRFVAYYAEGEPGTPIATVCSQGRVEIAVVNGSAAEILAIPVGSPVQIRI